MQFNCCRIFLCIILTMLMLHSLIYAGTTGKIAGRVIDKDTGSPLPGVNILVKGTYLGGATDLDGFYTILNVPPGLHTVEASMIGYATVTLNEVRVYIDQTTPLDIEMNTESLEMDAVVIVAQRDIIKKDVSSSVIAIDPEEITTLPVSSLEAIVGLQAGVEEGLVIRGGGADELLLQVDGVTLRDPRNNQPISSIPLSSIQEVSIERGGFNAEYGEVRSGLVNIVSREGGLDNYYAAIQLKYSPYTPKHFGISVYDPESMWNKPYLDDDVCWTGTQNGAWDKYTQQQYPDFQGWNTVSEALLSDDNPNNDLSPAGAQKVWLYERRRRPSFEPDYIIDASLGGPVPFISKSLGNLRFFSSFRFEKEMLLIPLSRDDYKDYSGSLKINSDISRDLKLQITGTMGKNYNVAVNETDRQFDDPGWGINGVQFWSPTNYMRTPYKIAEMTNEERAARIFVESWYSQAVVRHLSLASKLTGLNFINPNTFYEISFEYVNRDYTTGPLKERDLTKNYEVVPGYFVDEYPYGFYEGQETGVAGMFLGGHSGQIRDSSNLSSYSLKADLTSQVTKEHLLKVGMQFSYYDLNLDYGAIRKAYNFYNYVKEEWNPFRFSIYIQDKIEMLGFIANIGVRMDYLDQNTKWIDVDPFDPNYYSSGFSESKDYPQKDVKPDVSLSPRLGISHPITETSKLYFNFGHFKQMPSYEQVYRIGRSSNGSMQNVGDPTLEQAKTVAYQLGYDHVISTDYLIQVAAYYNDVTNQQAMTQYISEINNIGYFKANNNGYEDIRGFEFTLRKNSGRWIKGFANYTYNVITRGQFDRAQVNEDPSAQKELDDNTTTLYQQKPVPEPFANLNLTFLTPFDFGPKYFGIKPLSDWSINLLGEWRAGEHITYKTNPLREVINNVQLKDYYNFDLRINKTFDFKTLTLMFYMEVRNLFNFKRLSGAGFYDVEVDQYNYLASLHLPESKAYNNIPGNDRIGDYRKHGVEYQPIEQIGNINNVTNPNIKAIYYDRSSGIYYKFVDGVSEEVDKKTMDKILDDKAYIDMPNNTSFNFLNPRQIFYGINISFNL
jgi:outer membrane receptor protein involved in Fe transport